MKLRTTILALLAVLGGGQVALAASPAALPGPSPHAQVAAARADASPGFLVARVREGAGATLHTRPGGPTAARLGDRTEFGRPTALGVVRERGRWLAVTHPELPNGTLGWVERGSRFALSRVRVSLHADVSERTLELRRDGRLIQRLDVAVGRPGTPTPLGRFAVTDKLRGGDFGPYYGCCILAMSATQPNTPDGWEGGNRMAIHGTSAPGTIGQASSAGCLRGADPDLELLMRRVPDGTPVVVRG